MDLELETTAGRKDCDIPIYKDLPLSMVILQGWFNDQRKCFKLFARRLDDNQCLHLFTDQNVRDSVKEIYKDMWNREEFHRVAIENQGEHRKLAHLSYPGEKGRVGFAYWITCVFREIKKVGSLEELMEEIGTVEKAHSIFKRWFYKNKDLVRGLNAADAARILARYKHLRPEQRPLLARGALKGAAIHLDGQPSSRKIDWFEGQYSDEARRVALEEKAAEYITNSSQFKGKFQMEMGESWFCLMQKYIGR